MRKMKTRHALAKRVKVTGSGQLKRKCANTRHIATVRTQKQHRHLRKPRLVHSTDYKRLISQIQL